MLFLCWLQAISFYIFRTSFQKTGYAIIDVNEELINAILPFPTSIKLY